jgi:triacylglycerol lipase
LVRPRGYLDPTAHTIKFDGQSPPPGVPVARVGGIATSKITLDKLINRPISAEFHVGPELERVVGRTWPAKESHVVWLEITQ